MRSALSLAQEAAAQINPNLTGMRSALSLAQEAAAQINPNLTGMQSALSLAQRATAQFRSGEVAAEPILSLAQRVRAYANYAPDFQLPELPSMHSAGYNPAILEVIARLENPKAAVDAETLEISDIAFSQLNLIRDHVEYADPEFPGLEDEISELVVESVFESDADPLTPERQLSTAEWKRLLAFISSFLGSYGVNISAIEHLSPPDEYPGQQPIWAAGLALVMAVVVLVVFGDRLDGDCAANGSNESDPDGVNGRGHLRP